VQDQLLQMLDERSARAVHHALGPAGGAGRKENVEGVLEWELLKVDPPGFVEGDRVLPSQRVRNAGQIRMLFVQRGHNDEFQARQHLRDLGEAG